MDAPITPAPQMTTLGLSLLTIQGQYTYFLTPPAVSRQSEEWK
jgi:hypothetical protein